MVDFCMAIFCKVKNANPMGIRHGSHMLAGRPVCVALSSVDNSPGCFFGTDVNMGDSKNIEEFLGEN